MSWYSSPCYLAEFMLMEEQAAAERSTHGLINDARPKDARPCVHRDEAGADVHDAAAAASPKKAAPQQDGAGAAGLRES